MFIGKLESKAATSSNIVYFIGFCNAFPLSYWVWGPLLRSILFLSRTRALSRSALLGATEQRGEAKESHPAEELRLDEILLRRRCGHRDPRRIGGFTAAFLLHYPGRAHLHNRVSRLDGCGGARRNGAWQRRGSEKKAKRTCCKKSKRN